MDGLDLNADWSGPACQDINDLRSLTYYYSVMSGFVISLTNFFFRFAIIYIIKSIGFETITEETVKIRLFVFAVQFFNSGILILLIGANIDFLPKINVLLHGPYSDFTSDWYKNIGNTIVTNMMFTAVYPIIEYFLFGGLNYLKKVKD
mmetsp:Transcript_19443/g.29890  ORF Transcript_19443/g.29890 Transcript_19443/m.29890 type:complete len:148 (+) Transcript_19443:2188-2631(+)